MDRLTIRQTIEAVEFGQIRIPAFQRGFIWEPDRVAFFMDSIYKGYPFGSILIWRTNERLKAERELGPLSLPEPRADFPLDYVLDGQQRLTSVYLTFQSNVLLEESEQWKDIYIDLSIPGDAQETQFFALSHGAVDSARHFPLRALFDTVAYRRLTKHFDDTSATKIDSIQARFKEAVLPVQIFRTEEKSQVAVIFERINRQGVPLDTMQLLSAWTWSEEFQLQGQFEELTEELDDFGYSSSQIDENLLLRCTSAILVSDPRPEAIVDISGEQVRSRFDEVVNGVKGALDFLRANIGIQRIDNLPFQTILVPMAVFFAVSGNTEIVVNAEQRQKIIRWFWRVCFSRRYSSGVIRNLEDDIKAMLQLKGGQASNLGNFQTVIHTDFFIENIFGLRNVNTKTFILLISQEKPLSLVSGVPIDLSNKLKDYNKAEFHHLMPKAFVRKSPQTKHKDSCLANFAFISRSENKALGGKAPSIYREKMAQNMDEILPKALCPKSLFSDDFEKFIEERNTMLQERARQLIGLTGQQ